MAEADFSAFQRQYQKERILSELAVKGSSSPSELADSTNIKAEDMDKLISELVLQRLVENVAGKYYKLTYEGYRYANSLKSRQMKQTY